MPMHGDGAAAASAAFAAFAVAMTALWWWSRRGAGDGSRRGDASVVDLGGGFRLRRARPADLPALYAVCLQTGLCVRVTLSSSVFMRGRSVAARCAGDAGKDASAQFKDKDALGNR